MYVCLCKAVTDRTVRSLIRGGADSRAEIAERCGAGTDCGGCRGQIDELLEEELEARASCGSCPSAARAPSPASPGSSVFAPPPPAA